MGKNNIFLGFESDKEDNADYINMLINSEEDSTYKIKQNAFRAKIKEFGLTENTYGYLIGYYQMENLKMYYLYLNGRSEIMNEQGNQIKHASVFKKYLNDDALAMLNFNSQCYIRIVEKDNELNFHGVYTSVKKALQYLESLEYYNVNNFFDLSAAIVSASSK